MLSSGISVGTSYEHKENETCIATIQYANNIAVPRLRDEDHNTRSEGDRQRRRKGSWNDDRHSATSIYPSGRCTVAFVNPQVITRMSSSMRARDCFKHANTPTLDYCRKEKNSAAHTCTSPPLLGVRRHVFPDHTIIRIFQTAQTMHPQIPTPQISRARTRQQQRVNVESSIKTKYTVPNFPTAVRGGTVESRATPPTSLHRATEIIRYGSIKQTPPCPCLYTTLTEGLK